MKITVKHDSVLNADCDILIINLFEGIKIPGGATGAIDKALNNKISYVIRNSDYDDEDEYQGNFTGKLNEICFFPSLDRILAKQILIVGLGNSSDFSVNKIKVISKTAIEYASISDPSKVSTILHGAGIAGYKPFDCAEMIIEGILLGLKKMNNYNLKEFEIIENNISKIASIKRGIESGKKVFLMNNASIYSPITFPKIK